MDNKKEKDSNHGFCARIFIKGKCHSFNERIKHENPINENNIDKKNKAIVVKKYMNRFLQALVVLTAIIMVLLVFIK